MIEPDLPTDPAHPVDLFEIDAFGMLMEQVIAGNGLAGVIRLLSDMLGLPVTVADDEMEIMHGFAPRGRHLHPSETALDPALASTLRFDIEPLGQASTAPPTLRFVGRDEVGYAVAPVVLPNGIVGYVWAIDPSGQISARAEHLVGRAAAACAVEIVRQRAIIEGESRVRNSLLEDILTGDITSATATRRRARYLGYDLRGDQAVVVFDLDGFKEYVRAHGHDESAIQRLKDRFRRSLDSAIPGLWGRPLIWEHSDSLVMLVPAREEHPHALVERVETVRVRVQSRLAGPTVSAGIGRWYSDLSRLQQSYREAEHALRVGNAVSGPGATTAFTELGAYRLLYHLRDQPELRQFCEEALGALEQYDAEKGAELTTTLACYLDLQGNLSQTARELHLHRNGLLYRLSRIEEIAGCDLGDPAQRLTLQLALLVRPLLRPRKKPGAR